MKNNTMTIKYKIEFLDYWHMGSGLSAGAKLDSTVTKDKDGIPYVSGKTIKGLVREMAEFLEDEAFVEKCFGVEEVGMGVCYFSNVKLSEEIREEIVKHALEERLYEVIASTKIENSIAVDNSLREIEVVLPLSLEGVINDVPSEYMNNMKKALKMIKRMGLNRNRGLGRCEITVKVGA